MDEETRVNAVLDQCNAQRSQRDERLRVVRNRLATAADELYTELTRPGWLFFSVPNDAIGVAVKRVQDEFLGRARARVDYSDSKGTVEDLVHKLRLSVYLDLLFGTVGGLAWLEDYRRASAEDAAVVAAWSLIGSEPIDVPPRDLDEDDIPFEMEPPEQAGRDVGVNLRLWLVPRGPRATRPLPTDLEPVMNTGREAAALHDVLVAEIYRAALPAGLSDMYLRAKWFLTVLLLNANWRASSQATTADAALNQSGFGMSGLVAAVRFADGIRPPGDRFDRMRHAALIQDRFPGGTVADPGEDGWVSRVADIVFRDSRPYRFAVPWATALELVTVDPSGATIALQFGLDFHNRAARGDTQLEDKSQQVKNLAARKIRQRLLKEDQDPRHRKLRNLPPVEWHRVVVRAVHHAASTVNRPTSRETVPEPLADRPMDTDLNVLVSKFIDDEIHRAAPLYREIRPLVYVTAQTPWSIGRVKDRWVSSGRPVSTPMVRLLRWLVQFQHWLCQQVDNSRGTLPAELGVPVLRGHVPTLRQVMHHFVLTGKHRPGEAKIGQLVAHDQRTVRDRDSRQMYDAVRVMVHDVYLDPSGDKDRKPNQ